MIRFTFRVLSLISCGKSYLLSLSEPEPLFQKKNRQVRYFLCRIEETWENIVEEEQTVARDLDLAKPCVNLNFCHIQCLLAQKKTEWKYGWNRLGRGGGNRCSSVPLPSCRFIATADAVAPLCVFTQNLCCIRLNMHTCAPVLQTVVLNSSQGHYCSNNATWPAFQLSSTAVLQ